jgi:catechol-2,3-dioxygenase
VIIKDLSRTEEFYSKFLGNPILRNERLVVYKVGDTRLFFKTSPRETADFKYNKDEIGMNHVAFGVRTMEELKSFKELLVKAGIKHSDFTTGKFGNEYVWLDDPDGIRIEIFHRPAEKN